MSTRLEHWQVPLYLGAIAIAAVVGLSVPSFGEMLTPAINPVLALLLYATFLGVPFAAIRSAARDHRFLAAVLVLNFVVVPVVVLCLSRLVAGDDAILLGVLLVLLTPCIDYVIVFARLAGADSAKLLATTPLLMLGQILLLPLYLLVFVGSETAGLIEPWPFAEAFLVLIVIPLTAATATQWLAARHRSAQVVVSVAQGAMVPLMMLTLALVVASQIAGIGTELVRLAVVVPIFVAFLVVAVPLGMLAGRAARLDAPATRAVLFSGATRNSLVVLPLALAMPEQLSLASLVVVTQTLVELIGMVILVRLVPRLVTSHAE